MRTTHLVGGAPCGHARVTGRGADDLVEARVVDELGRQVARWVEAGVIRRDQADAILAMEGGGAEPAGRRAVAVEILGYVGGVLALVAGIVLGAETWAQIGRWGRVAVLGAGVAALVGAGWRLRADGRVLPRLASVLWFAAVAAWAGLLAVLLGGRSDEALGNPPLLVASGSLALAVGLWVGLAVALGLLVAGSTLGRPVLLGIGAAALVLFLSEVAATWWRSLGAPLALLLAGLGLVGAAVVLSRLRPGGGAATPPRPREPLSR